MFYAIGGADRRGSWLLIQRQPENPRFEGDRLRLKRVGAGVLIEPFEERPKKSVEEWFARLDAMGADPLVPNGRMQKLAPVRQIRANSVA